MIHIFGKTWSFNKKKNWTAATRFSLFSSIFPVARFHHLLIQKKGCQGHAALSLLFQKFWGQPKKSPYHVKSTRTHKKGWLPKFRRLFSSQKKNKSVPLVAKTNSQKLEIVILFWIHRQLTVFLQHFFLTTPHPVLSKRSNVPMIRVHKT